MPTRPNSNDELERFKSEINLVNYAISYGYRPVKGEISRNSAALKNPNSGHKIIITRESDGHYVYFSANGGSDQGSIVDFVQRQHGYSLGEVRKHLRSYSPGIADDRPQRAIMLHPVNKDRGDVVRRLATMPGVTHEGGHAYLQRRGLGDVLTHERFINRIRTGEKGEAVFPHYDQEGVCGYGLKNTGFTGFSAGGEKGVWTSNIKKEDTKLFIGESAIDCLSHFAIHKDEATRYLSTEGGWNPDKTPGLIKEAVAKHPGKTVILGFDNDEAGRKYEQATRGLLKDSGKEVITQWPTKGKDWNDQLTGRDSRKEKVAAKEPEQPKPAPDQERSGQASTTAKDYLKKLQIRRPQQPPQDKKKGRDWGR